MRQRSKSAAEWEEWMKWSPDEVFDGVFLTACSIAFFSGAGVSIVGWEIKFVDVGELCELIARCTGSRLMSERDCCGCWRERPWRMREGLRGVFGK